MTKDDVKAIREALGRALGRRVTQRDLGLALRLAPANAADTIRSWEDGSRDVTGPASVALELMAHSAKNGGAHKVREIFDLPPDYPRNPQG